MIGLIPEKTIIETNEAHNNEWRSPNDDPDLLTDKAVEGKSFCSFVPPGENNLIMSLMNRDTPLGNISLVNTGITNNSDDNILNNVLDPDDNVLNEIKHKVPPPKNP